MRCELSTKISALKRLKLLVLHSIIPWEYDDWGLMYDDVWCMMTGREEALY